MSSDLVKIFLLSLVAMFNPTLLAAVTVMLLLARAKRLMLGYEDLVLGVAALSVALLLRITARPSFQARRRATKEVKLRVRRQAGKPTESLPFRMLGKGDPRVTFVVGIALSLPGVSYLDALDHIRHLDPGVIATILLVVYFCVMQQILLELPLFGYLFEPERTQRSVRRFRSWMGRRGRISTVIVAAVVGVWLVARGLIALLH